MQYVVRYGDNLRMVAQTMLGDAERWAEIALLNDLSYPYISDSPMEGSATPGDILYLPLNDEEIVASNSTFGTDLLLSTDKVNLSYGRGGDLSIGADGDYSLVHELDCLKQDLAHRKMTPLGTVPYHPSYGSFLATIIGSKKDANWRTKATLETERTLRCDPRITDVTSIIVEDLPTGMKIGYTAVSKGIEFRAGGVE